MDDFGGRTDDDLFADDFEPIIESVTEAQPVAQPVAIADPTPAPNFIDEAQPEAVVPSVQPSQPTPTPRAPRTLAHSRHAAPAQQPRPRKHSPKKPAPKAEGKPVPVPVATPGDATTTTGDVSTPSEPTSTPAASTTTATTPARPGSNTALADRLASGANPRTKLSDSELADKMEKMRILSAEKSRKFEQAEQDSRSHQLAYEKGMEEARRRRAEEAERRRRSEVERRQMDQERAANRERKLKALGAKEGGWDEGKTVEDDRDRRAAFRGANGGIRGSRHASTNPEGEEPVREFDVDEFRGGRGRGRGRGGSRGGRGGRGGVAERNMGDEPIREFDVDEFRGGRARGRGRGGRGGYAERNTGEGANTHPQQQAKKPEQKPPKAEDFPALPPSAAKIDTKVDAMKPISLSPGLNSPIGQWDDEMAALDAKTA